MKPSNFLLNTDNVYPSIRRSGSYSFNKTGNTPGSFVLIDDASTDYDYLVWEESLGEVSIMSMFNIRYNGTCKVVVSGSNLIAYLGDNANRSGNLVWREYGL